MNHVLDPKYVVKRRPHGWVVQYFNHTTGRDTNQSVHSTRAEAEAEAERMNEAAKA